MIDNDYIFLVVLFIIIVLVFGIHAYFKKQEWKQNTEDWDNIKEGDNVRIIEHWSFNLIPGTTVHKERVVKKFSTDNDDYIKFEWYGTISKDQFIYGDYTRPLRRTFELC